LYANGGKVARSRPGEFQVGNPDAGVGVAATMGISGNALFGGTGIVTATKYYGDGSSLTGISGGVTSDGQGNTVGGTNAGDAFSGTNANANTIFGYNAGTDLDTGDNNVFIGYEAGANATSSGNAVAVGFRALYNMGASRNYQTAVGYEALYSNAHGQECTAVGYQALRANNTGDDQCAFGVYSLKASNGANNTAFGYKSLMDVSSGSQNAAFGSLALENNTGSSNCALGYKAGDTLGNGSNNIFLGQNTQPSSTTVSNEVTIGDANITKFRIPGVKFEAENDEYHFSCDHNLTSWVQRFDGVWGNWSPNFNFKATGASPSGTTLGQWGNHQNGHALCFVKSRDNGNSGTACAPGDDLGSIFWSPFNSNNSGCAAAVKVMADSGTWSSSSNPAYMQIMTTPNGDKEPTERIRIASSGNVGINTTTPTYKFEVHGGTNAALFSHTGGACVVMSRSAKTLSFNANYAASGSHASIDMTSGMALAIYNGGTRRVNFQSAGHLEPQGDASQNLGASGKRWANVYTADMQLSNEGSQNDIDGTWGNYTIQEGESDLFLINRRSGKKYKFNLTEVP